MTQLGGTNVQSSAPEVRDIIEKGVADAVTFPWGSIAAVRHRQGDEVPHGRAALRHDLRLRDEQGKYNADVGRAEEGDRRPLHHRMGRQGRRARGPTSSTPASQKLKADPAHEVYTLTAEQLAEWKKAAEPLVKTWADGVKKAGGDPDAILKELKATLAKYNAAY